MLFSLQLISKPVCWQSLLRFLSPSFSKRALLAAQEQVSALWGRTLQMRLRSSNPGSELHRALEQLRSGFEDCS